MWYFHDVATCWFGHKRVSSNPQSRAMSIRLASQDSGRNIAEYRTGDVYDVDAIFARYVLASPPLRSFPRACSDFN